MKKTILNLVGVKELSKNEQKIVSGGKVPAGCLKWNPITRYCSLWDPNYNPRNN